MPKIGVMGPWIAEYRNVNGVVSYRNGVKAAKMTEYDATPNDAGDDNDFFADNGLSETDSAGNSGGEITDSVDHLTQEASRMILGLRQDTMEVGGQDVPYLVYDDDMNPGYFGHAIIIKKMKNGQILWNPVIHTKIKYNNPQKAATTQGAEIDWQVEELTARYMQDDTAKHRTMVETTVDDLDTATAFVEAFLNIPRLGVLTVTSVAGTAVGDTTITVTPALISGNSYMYTVAQDVGLPAYNQLITEGYQAWNGTDEITAMSGQQILVVEIDAESRAQKGGIATVVSNDG